MLNGVKPKLAELPPEYWGIFNVVPFHVEAPEVPVVVRVISVEFVGTAQVKVPEPLFCKNVLAAPCVFGSTYGIFKLAPKVVGAWIFIE